MDIEGFIAQHLAALEAEQDSEIEATRELQANWTASQLQRIGYALVGLRITATRTGLGGKTLVTAEAPVMGDALAANTLRAGDIVQLESARSKTTARAVIAAISDKKAVVACDDVPDEWGERCSMRKMASDTTHRRMRRALESLRDADSPVRATLFGLAPALTADRDPVEWMDETLDESQREAVHACLAARTVALVHGPPGTGKTRTVVEVVRQLVARGRRVLVCAPSNVAVDTLAERLVRGRVRLVRIGHPARLLPAVVPYSLDSIARDSEDAQVLRDVRADIDAALARVAKSRHRAERRALYGEIKELRREFRAREGKVVAQSIARAAVVLATLSGAQRADLGRFDVVVIDEATQAVEAECWIAALRADKLVLAGDHHQLPPTVLSRDASTRRVLEATLFDRARRSLAPAVCRMLEVQYRMHGDIMRVSADRLYGSRLVAHASVARHLLCDIEGVASSDDTEAAVVFIDTAQAVMLESAALDSLADADSKLNRGEADLAARHVAALVAAGVAESEIAVISPYNAQVRLLKELVCGRFPHVEVGSVDGFQGREKDAVVVSLVRSNADREIGFLADYRRINVAITRARRHLCLVADSSTVAARDPFLKALVAHFEDVADLRYP